MWAFLLIERCMRLNYIFLIMQIVLESLPVSSSGHIQLIASCAERNALFFPLHDDPMVRTLVMYIIHLPTLFIIAFFFYRQWIPFFVHFKRLFSFTVYLFFWNLLVTIITTLFFLAKQYLALSMPLWIGFLVTMICLATLRYPFLVDKKSVKMSDAVIIGMAQGAALFPGISRLASVFFACRLLGFSHKRSFLISWMVEVPLIIGASSGALLYAALYKPIVFAFFSPLVLVLIFLATLVGTFAFYGVAAMAERAMLWRFSWYMLLPLTISLFCC